MKMTKEDNAAFVNSYMNNCAIGSREDVETIINARDWNTEVCELDGSTSIMDSYLIWMDACKHAKLK